MKTSNIITTLRCKTTEKSKCKTCAARVECNTLFGPYSYNGEEAIAERLEQLLENLRTTQEQLKTVKGERDAWRKRYMKLQNSLKNVVHENELLDNLIN